MINKELSTQFLTTCFSKKTSDSMLSSIQKLTIRSDRSQSVKINNFLMTKYQYHQVCYPLFYLIILSTILHLTNHTFKNMPPHFINTTTEISSHQISQKSKWCKTGAIKMASNWMLQKLKSWPFRVFKHSIDTVRNIKMRHSSHSIAK